MLNYVKPSNKFAKANLHEKLFLYRTWKKVFVNIFDAKKNNCFKFLRNNYLENIKCESLLGNYLERPFGNKDVNTKVYKG